MSKNPRIKLQASWPEGIVPDRRSFKEISKSFELSFTKLMDPKNRFSVADYFGDGVGLKTSQSLFEDKYKLREDDSDFQGIYIFFIDGEPIYTGISKVILKRLQQHVKGKSHFTSSLCYKMGADYHKELSGEAHAGGREGLCFKTYSEPFKKIIKENSEVSLLPIESPIELYLFECYVAMNANTHYYNRFETH
ncbi:GIY-YIG nuclease family protein [Christiangramia portivictoriae]|uniref:GIY-YIG nuclease family protein n=1 Tax=Christiangramia portivictoriae TaxID=326069 RepID=UPI000406846D|nr:GIY-YIG nuclease family protein [Christiangramia portivictoriae]